MDSSSRRTRARFLRMLRSFSRSEVGGKARFLFATLIVLLVGINGLNVLNSYVGRDFFTALEQRHVPVFLRVAAVYLGVFALSTAAEVFLRYTEETLGLTWREWLSRWTVRHYLRPPVYQRLSDRLIAEGEIPNPDERIAEDIRSFTTVSLSILLLSLNGTFTIVAFSGVLWSISPRLFVVGVLYAVMGSVLAYAWGKPLVKLNEVQLDQEANFRADLIHVREHADALAMSRREDVVLRRLLGRVEGWATNLRRIIRVNRNLGFCVTGYRYLIQILPALIVAPLFIRGDVEFGVITQAAMAFAQLVGAFSLLINQFQPISNYAAVVQRLGVLDEGIERARTRPVLPTEVCTHHSRTSTCRVCAGRPLPPVSIELRDADELGFEKLTLWSKSDGRLLLKELTGAMAPGARVLIGGPNEEAKVALFRSVAEVWTMGAGRIWRPSDGLALLPERPYLPPGTLREALAGLRPIPNPVLERAIREAGLEGVVARLGGLEVERRWESVLSLGEQQLVACTAARLLSPKVVLLERPGTALDPEPLSRTLRLFAEAGATLGVIGRREDTPGLFTSELTLAEDGSWEWSSPQRSMGTRDPKVA
ncbi:MAG: ABC transporter ATP-binding protein/permease [Planctomycetaceae bacterium]|nr:ABC transporter ATP-binding protein/permease [Planctomycetaceae bacterium]